MRCLDGAADASDGAAHLIRLEQRAVHHKTTDAGVEQLRYLRREVDGVGVVQARAAVDVGAHGHDLAVDILERQLAGAQAAVGAIVDAAIGHLQDAVLARHNARAAENGDAQGCGRGGTKRDNLIERDLGREPKRAGSALGKCLHARGVVHGQARADLRRGTNLGGQGKLGYIADSDRGAGNNPRVNAYVVNGAADLVVNTAKFAKNTMILT